MSEGYDPNKALEVLLYVVARVDGSLYTTLKIIYFADKLHLQRFGRQLYGDDFAALAHGPVPSKAYDAAKVARGDSESYTDIPGVNDALEADPDNPQRRLIPLRQADLDQLSRSDIQCLDEAIERWGSQPFECLKDESHDQAWRATPPNRIMSLNDIIDQLPNADDIRDHLSIHSTA